MSERKYRHSGYMDSSYNRNDRKERPPQQKRERPLQDLPRPGRGMERSAMEVTRCSSCGTALQPGTVVSPDSCCSSCAAPLHCCRNCSFFDTSTRYECAQPIAAAIPGKAAPNACESFQMRAVLDATGRRSVASTAGAGGPADPRAAFDALFKKK